MRARVVSTAAQQTADLVGSAARDYAGTQRRLYGDYTKSFPSVHLTHDQQQFTFFPGLLKDWALSPITPSSKPTATSAARRIGRRARCPASIVQWRYKKFGARVLHNYVGVFNDAQRWYIGTSDRLQQTIINGTTITAGVNGRF